MSIYINNSAKVRINTKYNTKIFNRGPLSITFGGNYNTPINWTGGDPYDVANWNTYFDLPNFGNPFDFVTISAINDLGESNVKLFGSGNNTIKSSLFQNETFLISISDLGNYIKEIQEFAFINTSIVQINFPKVENILFQAFEGCTSITALNFPMVLNIGDKCFKNCTSISYINLPICNELGQSGGNDGVFSGITNQTITANFNYYLKTLNGGAYDGDIQYLIDPTNGNTVTITWIG